jgi:LmbE family N-acetylglucosaminyl deacetylase
MRRLLLAGDRNKKLRILCLGAHADDIEIGCGGTILRLLKEHGDVDVHWVVFSASGNPQREAEAKQSAESILATSRSKTVIIRDFRDGFFPYIGAEVKEFFETLKGQIRPDVIFTHYRNDLHQDHRLLSNLTWNTFRDHLVLEYEIAKYDGDLGSPNFFVPLDADTSKAKVAVLIENFESQKEKHWFSRDVFEAMLRVRGLQCNSQSGFAEAFYSHKVIM